MRENTAPQSCQFNSGNNRLFTKIFIYSESAFEAEQNTVNTVLEAHGLLFFDPFF